MVVFGESWNAFSARKVSVSTCFSFALSKRWLAILNSLLFPETDRNIRIGKQGYVFVLSDFKK